MLADPKRLITPALEDILFTLDDIKAEINLPLNATPGTDGITPKILKECADTLALPIYLLWKKSMECGDVPTLFKQSIVIPIYKKWEKRST